MENIKITKYSYDTFGKVLVKIQFFEQLVKIFISLFNKDAKLRNKRINNLSYKDILDDNILKRNQTLGILMSVIKKEMKIFDNDEFNELLEKRNIFIHKLHKEYLSNDSLDEEELTRFINQLWNLINKYIDIFTGLISLSVKTISNNKIDTSGIDKCEENLIRYITSAKE
ncbi:hypothetical protein N5U17_01470 [Aliarcobacter butzleri]|uniref:hypothetical protein n=1 Tax=Aliarcobacter butzleri TaxID=28197 RepID=UPI0021B3BE41|nr:hypothetical protein [Aliarcobacter butzleri]MCT7602892.1 hypothetical protein [Aliarcobacter butzleri]